MSLRPRANSGAYYEELLVLEFDRMVALGNARMTRYLPEEGVVVLEFIQYPASYQREGWRVLVRIDDRGETTCTWAPSYLPPRNGWGVNRVL